MQTDLERWLITAKSFNNSYMAAAKSNCVFEFSWAWDRDYLGVNPFKNSKADSSM